MTHLVEFERWKKAVLTRPDRQFFDMMRASLGNIKTPFNKHALLKKLITYLKSHETRKRIQSLLTDGDAYLLSVIYVLNSPDLQRVYNFLKGQMNYLDLHNHLLNLEERLLIYRSIEGDGVKIRFNPYFSDDLHSAVLDPGTIFESAGGSPGPRPWIRDQLVLAVIALIREHPEPFKAGNKFKNKVGSGIRDRFSFPDGADPEKRVRLMVESLDAAGILTVDNGKYSVAIPRLLSFCTLQPAERALTLAAAPAAALAADGGGDAPEYYQAAHLLYESLDHQRIYHASVLSRILIAAGYSFSEDESGTLFEMMFSFGLFASEERGYTPCPFGSPESENDVPIIVQPNFEVTLTAAASFSQGLELALAAEIQSYDIFLVFELTRDSVTRRFADGIEASTLQESIEELSGNTLPSNVLFSLKSWEKEFLSIRIFQGSVLLVDPDRRHLVEHNKEMARLISSIPQPGVYLIGTTDQDQIDKALKSCGILQKPAIEGVGNLDFSDSAGHAQETDLIENSGPQIKDAISLILSANKKPQQKEPPGFNVIDELETKLKSMKLSKDASDELSRMIGKRLILYPAQLDYFASSPREKNEARGFDYVGKVRIIEQALTRDDLLLEITTRGSGGKSTNILIKPLELTKAASDLVLTGKVLPNQTEKKLRVRAMSMVRSVHGSLLSV